MGVVDGRDVAEGAGRAPRPHGWRICCAGRGGSSYNSSLRSKFFRDVKYGMDTGRRKNAKVGTLHPEAWEAKSKPWKKIHRNGCQSRHMFRSPIHEGARWRYHLYYRIHCRQSKKKFIDSYLKSIYPESLGRAWTLGGPFVPPSLVRRSGSPDLLVRSDGEFSAVEGMPLESSLSKASQKSNTTERKKR